MVKNIAKNFPALTAREVSIVTCIAAGLSNGATAARLSITERTVKNVIGPIALKMGAGSGGSVRVRIALLAHGLPVELD